MTSGPSSSWVDVGGHLLHVLRWDPPPASPPRPPAVLLHGTGLVARTWAPVAAALAADREVLAVDRRGHGRSGAPAGGGWDHGDFAADLVALIDVLGLRGALGVGHSAGGTDVLLAAARRPAAFAHVVALEPTIADPAAPPAPGPLGDGHRASLERHRRRRARFPDRATARARFAARPPHGAWRPDVLDAYLDDGFRVGDDGSLHLACRPDVEAAVLEPILHAMAGTYVGGDDGHPFEVLAGLKAATTITTSGRSTPVYAAMAAVALRLVPHARHHVFPTASHFVPHEDPGAVVALLRG